MALQFLTHLSLKSGTGFAGARFRLRLDYFCSKPESGVHVTETIIYDLFLFNLPLATISAIIIAVVCDFVVYVAFNHVYFRRQKFSFQTYIVHAHCLSLSAVSVRASDLWSTGREFDRRRKLAPENGIDLWRWFLERVSSVLAYRFLRRQHSGYKCNTAFLHCGYQSDSRVIEFSAPRSLSAG